MIKPLYQKVPHSKKRACNGAVTPWLGFYRNHRLLYEYLIKTFKEFGGIGEAGAELAEVLSFNVAPAGVHKFISFCINF